MAKTLKKPLSKRRRLAIAVAEDALKWIGRSDIGGGGYLDGCLGKPVEPTEDMQKHATSIIKNCSMCLLGACLVAKARVQDQVPLAEFLVPGDDPDYSDTTGRISAEREAVVARLRGIFGEATCDYIEEAFEGFSSGHPYSEAAMDFNLYFTVRGYPSGLQTARAVLKEIIRQRGTFNPKVALDHLNKKKA